MYNFTISKKVNVPGLISLDGGVAFNSVIEKCFVQMELNETIIPYLLKNHPNAKIKTIDDVVNITFFGKAAHGSIPQYGNNAGMEAIRFIALYTKNKTFLSLLEKFDDVYGKGLGIYYKSKEMGETSLNVGLAKYKNETISLVVNSRFPENAKLDQVATKIKENTIGFKISNISTSPLLYFSKKSKLVSTLLNSYILETGDKEAEPLTTGGGTYAKEANNVVAFGMNFPGWDPSMHGVDEKVKESHLNDAMAIYARAIIDLGRIL